MAGATILFSGMTPDYDWEDRFNKWYNGHYVPIRMGAPGFLSARRYREADRPNYLAVYELEDEATLESEAYAKIRSLPHAETRWILDNVAGRARYVGNLISDQRRDDLADDALDAPVLYSVFFSVPDDRAEDFNAWYTQEHVPMLLECRQWLSCRRFLIQDGEPQPWTHLALHYLADVAALDSPERAAARETEWRRRLSAEPWFKASYQIFESIGERFRSSD